MNQAQLTTSFLWLLSGIFGLISLTCLIDPRLLLDTMEVGLESASALAEARAGYCGTFAGLSALSLIGAKEARFRRLALGIATLVLGAFTVARLLSLALDGRPNDMAFVNHAVEGLGFAVALWFWLKSPVAPQLPSR